MHWCVGTADVRLLGRGCKISDSASFVRCSHIHPTMSAEFSTSSRLQYESIVPWKRYIVSMAVSGHRRIDSDPDREKLKLWITFSKVHPCSYRSFELCHSKGPAFPPLSNKRPHTNVQGKKTRRPSGMLGSFYSVESVPDASIEILSLHLRYITRGLRHQAVVVLLGKVNRRRMQEHFLTLVEVSLGGARSVLLNVIFTRTFVATVS